jgi:SOS-response transcriptional repressor LexA
MQTQEIEIAELNSLENSPYIDHLVNGGSFYGVNGWCRQPSLTRLAPASVHPQTVIMQDDSMAPTFLKGDVLTINYDVFEEPGDYMLVRFGHLLLIRRYADRGDNDHVDFMPENPAYPLILDDGAPDPWGVVSAVRHSDGNTQTFDLSKRRKIEEFEMWAELKVIAPSAASPSVAVSSQN